MALRNRLGVLMARARAVSQTVYRRISATSVPNENLRLAKTARALMHLRRTCYNGQHA